MSQQIGTRSWRHADVCGVGISRREVLESRWIQNDLCEEHEEVMYQWHVEKSGSLWQVYYCDEHYNVYLFPNGGTSTVALPNRFFVSKEKAEKALERHLS